MNPLLQTHFDSALEHPNGIKKLRELILTLAMQGKLIPQNPNDPPASELLKEIQAEKLRLVKEGKSKKSDPLPQIKEEEKPFAIPKGWEWVRLGDCTHVIMGQSPDSKTYNQISEGMPFYQGKTDYGKIYPTPKVWCSSPVKIAPKNSILISVRAPIGPTNLCIEDSCIGRGLASIVPLADCSLFFYLYLLRKFELTLASFGTGSTFQAITQKVLVNFPLPLPPLAEQKRIVEKIDELFQLCDQLEALKKQKDEKRKDLHQSVVTQMLEAETHADFQRHFQFLTTHFHELYSVKENVKELRKAVLQLAVMGKLVDQDPKDQLASELLKEIQAEKARLVKEGKIKKSEALSSKRIEELPCSLPKNWEWVRLKDLGFFTGGKTPSTNNSKFWNGNIPWVSAKDMKSEFIRDSEDHITQAGLATGLMLIPENSILMVVRSGILRRTFPVGINKVECTINQDLKALILHRKDLSIYIMLMLKGFEGFILEKLSKTGMTVESLTVEEFMNQRFPLPPLAEQKRIVEKVDQLMALCDRLEGEILKAESKRGEILEGMVRV